MRTEILPDGSRFEICKPVNINYRKKKKQLTAGTKGKVDYYNADTDTYMCTLFLPHGNTVLVELPSSYVAPPNSNAA